MRISTLRRGLGVLARRRGIHPAVAAALVASPAAAAELKIAVAADVTSIDPHFFNLFPNNNIAEHIFDKLVQMDPDSKMIPGIATSWKTIDDDDVGIQVAQGRQVPRRQRADRRGRRVLHRPRAAGAEQSGPFTAYTKAIVSKQIVDPVHACASSTRRPYPLAPNDLSTIYIVSKKVASECHDG